jgi:general secretion pathway protein M
MNISLHPGSNSLRYALAATIYVVLLGVLVATIWVALSTLLDRRATVLAAENLLAELDGRSTLSKNSSTPLAAAPTEFPFLEGPTVTVAGAALLQRVGGAITRASGNVLSSQVDLQRTDSKDGWIGLTISCDIEQGSLQKLLYDIEAGMPFLFIDQLVVQAPVTGVDQSRMRVLLTVSGRWWSGK